MSRSVKDSQGNWHIVAGAGGGGGGNDNCFIGTMAEWNALTPTEKDVFTSRDIVDDFNGFPIDNVPTENSNSLVRSGGVYSAINNLSAGDVYISGVEDSDTASQAYTVGRYLIYNKVLYKVISAIAQGDTLTPNTNIQVAKLADEFSDHLCVNGTEFYFDSHDGVFGYNTSPNRGADTFSPFRGTDYKVKTGTVNPNNKANTIQCDFKPLAVVVVCTSIYGNLATTFYNAAYSTTKIWYIDVDTGNPYTINNPNSQQRGLGKVTDDSITINSAGTWSNSASYYILGV